MVSGLVALISGILGLLGAGYSAYNNYRSQRQTNDLQVQLADQANQWQIENRDYENWFNSPSGLQSRGLNPALAMSASGSNLAQSADAGAANMPSDLSSPKLPDMGSVINDSLLTQSQISVNDAQAANLEAEAAYKSGMLSEEQKRSLILQKNADTESRRVNAYIDDVKNIILNRDKEFDLKKSMFEWGKQVDEEKLKQAWEEIGISKENLRLAIEIQPYLINKYKAECAQLFASAYELIQRGDKEGVEAALANINLRLERVLEDARNDVLELLKEGERWRVAAILDENRFKSGTFGAYNLALFNEDGELDVDLWDLYILNLTSGNSSINPSMFFDTRGLSRAGGNVVKKVVKRPVKVRGFGR